MVFKPEPDMWRPTGPHFRTPSLRPVHFTTCPNDHSTDLHNYADDTRLLYWCQFKRWYICQWHKMFIKGRTKIWLVPLCAVIIYERLNWILKPNVDCRQIIESWKFSFRGKWRESGPQGVLLFSLQSTFHHPDGCSAVYFVHHFGFNRSCLDWEQSPGLPCFSDFTPASETTAARDVDVAFPFWIVWPYF